MAERIIFAGSHPSEVPSREGASATTSGGGIDSAYCNVAISCNASKLAIDAEIPLGASDVWFHFRAWSSLIYNTGTSTGAKFLDESGAVLAEFRRVSSGSWPFARAHGDSVISGDSSPAMASGVGYIFDIHVVIGEDIQIDVYRDSSLISTATAPNTGEKGPIRHVELSGLTGTSTFQMSEFVLTEGFSTLGTRLARMEPVGDGTYSDMEGDYSDMISLDYDFGVVGRSPGERMSWTHRAYGGIAIEGGVLAVIGVVTTSKLPGTENNTAQFLRFNDTNYEGRALSNDAREQSWEVWTKNPITGLPWDTDDLADMEMGVVIKAPS